MVKNYNSRKYLILYILLVLFILAASSSIVYYQDKEHNLELKGKNNIIAERDKRVFQLTARIQLLNTELSDLRNELASLLENQTGNSEKIAELVKRINKLQSKIDASENQNSQTQNTIAVEQNEYDLTDTISSIVPLSEVPSEIVTPVEVTNSLALTAEITKCNSYQFNNGKYIRFRPVTNHEEINAFIFDYTFTRKLNDDENVTISVVNSLSGETIASKQVIQKLQAGPTGKAFITFDSHLIVDNVDYIVKVEYIDLNNVKMTIGGKLIRFNTTE